MSVSIKFDPNQQFQLDAIDAVVDLFEGQHLFGQLESQTFVPPDDSRTLPGFDELAYGNSLALSAETLRRNLRAVQDRPEVDEDGTERPQVPESLRQPISDDEAPLDFSLEMETGTGKTYVYLRSIAELNQRYGFRKFVIVVPSVAIREGVLTNLQLLRPHLREIYDGLQFDSFVYDSKQLTKVRQFAIASHLQIMVINIQAFTQKEKNLFHRPTDDLNGYAPVDFMKACRPIVIMDEPQAMETTKRKDALASLNPLFKLRYSATHRDPQHIVYRLTPVEAYDLRLVKRIEVLSIVKDVDLAQPFVEVSKITPKPESITATARIHKTTKQGTKPTKVTLRKDTDLYEESGNRDVYKGWIVEDIVAAAEERAPYVLFGNNRVLREKSSTGEGVEQLQRIQIREAINAHFEKELELFLAESRGLIAKTKPLTLFFIDKVAHYHPADGKFRIVFEEEYEAIRRDGRFALLSMPDVEDVHDGYFAVDKKGKAKDTGSDTKDAGEAYELIMRDKERLLDLETPLRFIFSHSALAEGWDNPNVFTICNLQDGKSEMRKRQQIGRGLRLPVMSDGDRCMVDDINSLTVIANEEFETFALALQQEIEEETGEKFEERIKNKRERIKLEPRKEVLESDLFKELWERISPRTEYRLAFKSVDLLEDATKRVKRMEPNPIPQIRFHIGKAGVTIEREGVGTSEPVSKGSEVVEEIGQIPDILGELSRRVPISRATIAKVLEGSGRLDEVRRDPTRFLDMSAEALEQALFNQLTDQIVYTPTDDHWTAEQFLVHEAYAFEKNCIPVTKSITTVVPYDSEVEKKFALDLEARDDVKLFLKLPSWFKVATPLGGYNPDWAIVREEPEGMFLYLVRETKGGTDLEKLRFEHEKLKIKFGTKHFEAIKVDYRFGETADDLLEPIST